MNRGSAAIEGSLHPTHPIVPAGSVPFPRREVGLALTARVPS